MVFTVEPIGSCIACAFIVGTMVDIALGRRPPEDFPRLLAGTDIWRLARPRRLTVCIWRRVRYPPDFYAEASTS